MVGKKRQATVPWFVYLIECKGGSIYTGITIDVEARYMAHATGKGGSYTRSHPPRRLLATIQFGDRSAASKAEFGIKQLPAAAKRELCRAHAASEETANKLAQQARSLKKN
jgi:putative endonuclease